MYGTTALVVNLLQVLIRCTLRQPCMLCTPLPQCAVLCPALLCCAVLHVILQAEVQRGLLAQFQG